MNCQVDEGSSWPQKGMKPWPNGTTNPSQVSKSKLASVAGDQTVLPSRAKLQNQNLRIARLAKKHSIVWCNATASYDICHCVGMIFVSFALTKG